jgi:hypothetical protein
MPDANQDMKYSFVKAFSQSERVARFKHNFKELFVIVAAWGIALALVYLVYLKIRLFIHH